MLTKLPFNDQLDLSAWVGQRSATFTFNLVNGVTGQNLGEINPIRGTAQLTHETTSTIKRQLSLSLGVADTAEINPITDRIDVDMVVAGSSWPLGRYMFTDLSRQVSTGGNEAVISLTDEMFAVGQAITSGFDAGIHATVPVAVQTLLAGLGVELEIEASPFQAAQSWAIGSNRGQILDALSVSGDYFGPWFGNDRKLHFIRSFNPATQVPDFDWDAGNQVIRDTITLSDDLLTAPNRFIVISNASTDTSIPISAAVDVPPTAPHSVVNRGFVIPEVQSLPVMNNAQALAVAQNLALRQTIFEKTAISTAPDPRHDSYNVIQWQGELWLETAWSMSLTEGASMAHTIRKAYT